MLGTWSYWRGLGKIEEAQYWQLKDLYDPDFLDRKNRIGELISKGVLRLRRVRVGEGNLVTYWTVPSASFPGVEYEIRIKIVDFKDYLKEEETVLAAVRRALKEAELRANCSCPAFCLEGNVKISLLNGEILSMEELFKKYGTEREFWVYSVDKEGDFVPGKARCLGITGYVDKVVEVELDNGRKFKCTPEHLIMSRDGSYKQAKDLKSGDSLMPLYFDFYRVGGKYAKYYKRVRLNSKVKKRSNRPIWKTVHRIVAERVLDKEYCDVYNKMISTGLEKGLVVHRKDFNALNNHKIINVTVLNFLEKIPMYDIEVDRYSNFLIEDSVIVHNSYWGSAYIYTNIDSKFGVGERRFPKVRNPDLRGSGCKHLDYVLRVLPFWSAGITSMAKRAMRRVPE